MTEKTVKPPAMARAVTRRKPKGEAPAHPGLASRAGELLAGLSGDLAAAEAGQPVHGARRRIKRLRSYARLMREVAGEDAYRTACGHLKNAADALSGLRRTEALQAAASRFYEKLPEAKLLEQVIAAHHAAHADAAVATISLARARQELQSAEAMLAGWRLMAADLPGVAEAFAATYRKARKQLRAALDSKDPEALHEARKHVIHHMHHLELLAPGTQAERIAALNRLRDVLGDFNDLVELEHLAEAATPGPGRPVLKAMHARRKVLLAKARKVWKPLFGKTTTSFTRHMVPSLETLQP